MQLLQNILSCTGTFLVISSLITLIVQLLICLFKWQKFNWNNPINSKAIMLGVIVVIALIPFYYIPA